MVLRCAGSRGDYDQKDQHSNNLLAPTESTLHYIKGPTIDPTIMKQIYKVY